MADSLPAIVRPIKTVYYNHRKDPLHVNSSMHVDLAVPRAVWHMQIDHYEARACEVFDESSGTLWAVVSRQVTGRITIHYKREIPRPALP